MSKGKSTLFTDGRVTPIRFIKSRRTDQWAVLSLVIPIIGTFAVLGDFFAAGTYTVLVLLGIVVSQLP